MFAAKKHLIKSIGANKTEQSISRVTRSADAIDEICSNFDSSILLNPKVEDIPKQSQRPMKYGYSKSFESSGHSHLPMVGCVMVSKISHMYC